MGEPIRNVKFKILDAASRVRPYTEEVAVIRPRDEYATRHSDGRSSTHGTDTAVEKMRCPADCVQAVYPVFLAGEGI